MKNITHLKKDIIEQAETFKINNDYQAMLSSDVCGEFTKDIVKNIESIIKQDEKTLITTDSSLDNIVLVNNNTFANLTVWQKVVVDIINRINKIEFNRNDLKTYEIYLKELYPESKTPMQTVSRVLQELRDIGLLKFYGNGRYKKLWENINV